MLQNAQEVIKPVATGIFFLGLQFFHVSLFLFCIFPRKKFIRLHFLQKLFYYFLSLTKVWPKNFYKFFGSGSRIWWIHLVNLRQKFFSHCFINFSRNCNIKNFFFYSTLYLFQLSLVLIMVAKFQFMLDEIRGVTYKIESPKVGGQ